MSRERAVLPAVTRSLLAATVLAAPVLLVASPASATALATKAQFSGGSLLIEGQADLWNAPITVDGVVMATTPTTAGTGTVTLHATDANGLTADPYLRDEGDVGDPALDRPRAVGPARCRPVHEPLDRRRRWGDAVPLGRGRGGDAPPPGMSLIQDAVTGPSVRVGGTPTAAGTYDWCCSSPTPGAPP